MKRSLCQKSPISLKDGALFIADAHYQKGVREELLDLLKRVDAPQIFFMGDIFDLLVGKVKKTIEENKEAIELLNELSSRSDCYYLEGNHDFLVSNLFPNVKVADRFSQPLIVCADEKRVALSHGDIYIDGLYRYYIELLHSPLIYLLNLLNIQGWISNKIQSYNASKELCKQIANFSSLAQKRASFYEADIIIEGHFHQRDIFLFGRKTYINLPSYACSHEFLRYVEGKFILTSEIQ